MRKSKTNVTLNRQRNSRRYILSFAIKLPQQYGNILSSCLLFDDSCKVLNGDAWVFTHHGWNQSFGRTIWRCFKLGMYCEDIVVVIFSYIFVITKSCKRCVKTIADLFQRTRGVVNKNFQGLRHWDNNNNKVYYPRVYVRNTEWRVSQGFE